MNSLLPDGRAAGRYESEAQKVRCPMKQESFPWMQADAPLRPADIRRIVAAKLVGLADRQRVREAIRMKARKRTRRQLATQDHLGEECFMKSPVTFRAEFRGPLGVLNPAGFLVPGTIEVEIYHAKVGPPAEWRVRRPKSNRDFPITPQSRPDTVKNQMLQYFSEQSTRWEAYAGQSEALADDEWKMDKDGKISLTPIRLEREKERHALAKVEH
jgi:hypothetical protein